MLTLRRFTEQDYFAFAGAEEFDDGYEPLIGDIQIPGSTDYPAAEFTVVACLNTVQVLSSDGECYNVKSGNEVNALARMYDTMSASAFANLIESGMLEEI